MFQSNAPDLLAGNADSNGATAIFLRDISSPSITCLSADANGTRVTGASTRPSISGDNQYVVCELQSVFLVVPDANGAEADIFVRE